MKFLVITVLLFGGNVLAKNPLFPGWYGDPDAKVYENTYWIFPTSSVSNNEPQIFDAFSSIDLINWQKHPKVLEMKNIKWAENGIWSPSVFQHKEKYHLLFASKVKKIHNIGIAVAEKPEGPYRDMLGEPLIQNYIHGVDLREPAIFKDDDGAIYTFYAAEGRRNVVKLSKDLTAPVNFVDGKLYKEVYMEGFRSAPCMFKRNGTYYMTWVEVIEYKHTVVYGMSKSVLGPFRRGGMILENNPKISSKLGQASIMEDHEKGKYFVVYQRMPLNEVDERHVTICMEELNFNPNGTIQLAKATVEGAQSSMSWMLSAKYQTSVFCLILHILLIY